MKRYLAFSLLVLGLFVSANAQNLVYGGKPKLPTKTMNRKML